MDDSFDSLPSSSRQGRRSLFDVLSPKWTFLVGVAGGVLFVCTIGFFVLLGYVLTGKVPRREKTPPVSSPTAAAPSPLQQGNPQAQPVPPVTDQDHVRGAQDAEISIIEYSDYECPFCKQFHPTLKKILADFPNDVRWVYRHFPLDSIHPNARKEAEAAECVADVAGNDVFWKFTDLIFERTRSGGRGIALEDLPKLAREAGASGTKFDVCLQSGRKAQAVEDHLQGGVGAGVEGTPGSFINGAHIKGLVSYERLKSFIRSQMR